MIRLSFPKLGTSALKAIVDFGLDPTVFRKLRYADRLILGEFMNDGWNGKLPFIAFVCKECKKIQVDYPHGFNKYLDCEDCKDGPSK